MKWVVEDVGTHANILEDDGSGRTVDMPPIGMGFPLALAERLVTTHNDAVERLIAVVEAAKTVVNSEGMVSGYNVPPTLDKNLDKLEAALEELEK